MLTLRFQGDGATRGGVTVGLGLAVRRGIVVGRELADAAVTSGSLPQWTLYVEAPLP